MDPPGGAHPVLTSPPDTVAPAPAPRSRARLIFILGALTAFGPLSIDMYLPGLPALAGALDAPASAAQLTLTACLAASRSGRSWPAR
jgi:DHA1 family bicyclomycin/chloramphenicol resistance-like MFS transporter